MIIEDSAVYGIIGTLGGAILAIFLYLHKDMKSSIMKLADLLMPLQRTVDKHEIKIEEHGRLHAQHSTAIEELKKNTNKLHSRIEKIEDTKAN